MSVLKWTEEALRLDAAKYPSRGDWYQFSSGAYTACRKRYPRLLDELLPRLRRQHTLESMLQLLELKKYQSRAEWQYDDSGSYQMCLLRFPELMETLPLLARKWTKELLEKELLKYTSRVEWQHADGGAYRTCLDKFPEILARLPNVDIFNTREMIYVWRAVEIEGLYKIGISSKNRYKRRITEVARSANVTPTVVFIAKAGAYLTAIQLETELKQFGVPYNFSKAFNGHTEFRKLTADELTKIKAKVLSTAGVEVLE